MKNLVILGSARYQSHTMKAIEQLCPFKDYEVIDLYELNIEHYDYKNKEHDDFHKVALKMQDAENVIFATQGFEVPL